MKITPHQFQSEASQSIFEYFNSKHGNPLVAMPTGTGKSVVIAAFLQEVFRLYRQQKVMCLTHVKELIQQNFLKLINLWPDAPAGINSAGLGKRDTNHPIIFAGIQSVDKYAAQFGHVDLIIIDECHLVSPDEETRYNKFIKDLRAINPYLKVIGFTATPWRTGVGLLTSGNLFTDFCFNITGMDSFNRLIEEGYLCPLVTPSRNVTIMDVSGVHMRGGDFIDSELQNAVDRDEITELACKQALEHGHDRHHWLGFCAGVDHAVHTAEMLNAMDIPTVAIHSKMKGRDKALQDWMSGRYRCAVNNNVLTTGIDFPAVDLILMMRPTASTNLWIQMLGRGTRCLYAPGFNIADYVQRLQAIQIAGKNNCLVLDFAGNTKRLGPINDPVIPRKKGEKAGDAPIKICDQCGVYLHASVRKCDNCGYEFVFVTKLKTKASTQDLIKSKDLPQVEMFKIDHITFDKNIKVGAPPSMRVSYYCGLRKFNDFVCLEHQGYPQRKAFRWWADRSDLPIPATIDEALKLSSKLRVPTHLNVWINKKYPEVVKYCFDGTGFGTVDPDNIAQAPTVEDKSSWNPPQNAQDFEDDIPF